MIFLSKFQNIFCVWSYLISGINVGRGYKGSVNVFWRSIGILREFCGNRLNMKIDYFVKIRENSGNKSKCRYANWGKG